MRKAYIVTYDISDPRRLRQVYKVMKGWGAHIQLSVFRCELNRTELVRLQVELLEEMNSSEDQVLIIDLGPADGRGQDCIRSLGRPYGPRDRGSIII